MPAPTDTEDSPETLNLDDASAGKATTDEQEDRGDIVTPVKDAASDDKAGDPPAAPAPPAPSPAPAPAHDTDDEAGATGKPEQRIPKARFDEVNNERRQLQQDNARLQAELDAAKKSPAAPAAPTPPAPPAFDIDAKEEAYAEALLDADTKKAAAIRREINEHIQNEATSRATAQAEASYKARARQDDLQAAADKATAKYPFLNDPASDDVQEMIIALRDKKIRAGIPAGQALTEAVEHIAPKFAPAAAPSTPTTALPDKAAPADTRTADAIKRGAADSQSQPPAPQAGIGNRPAAARVDVENLTEKQFDELPEAEKRRLRGD